MLYVIGLDGTLKSCFTAYRAFKKRLNVELVIFKDKHGTLETQNNIEAIVGYTDYPVYFCVAPEIFTYLHDIYSTTVNLHTLTLCEIILHTLLYQIADRDCAKIVLNANNFASIKILNPDMKYIRLCWGELKLGIFPSDFPLLSDKQLCHYKKMIWDMDIDYNPTEALKTLRLIGYRKHGEKNIDGN